MIYGKRPFGHDMSQERILKEGLMLKVLDLEFPSKPNISENSKLFIRRCLEYYEDKRINVFEAYELINN